MVMLQDKLEQALREFYMQKHGLVRPVVIIMNPQTWWLLFDQLYGPGSTAIAHHGNPSDCLAYKGIKIRRSLDLKEEIFEVY